MTQNQINAGKEAKSVGHLNEQLVCKWLNEHYGEGHIVDGTTKTKKDIININSNISYSLKSVSKNHTQCHLTTKERWCEYFKIDGKLKEWFDLFFGIPGEDVSKGLSRHHRLTKSTIDDSYNNLAITWFNDCKMHIFDVIVCSGMNETTVDNLIWYDKPTKKIEIYQIDKLKQLVYTGKWFLNETTLHFLTNEECKLFHLQMKGSGKKYTAGYHGLMFHIHKCF